MGSDHWRTPPEVIELARGILGAIELDPAASRSERHWFAGENWRSRGLTREWAGLVYLNPPYSQLSTWVPYASEQRLAVVLALIPPAVGTNYWHDHVWKPPRPNGHRYAAAVAFPRGRFSFLDGRGRARNGNRYESALVLWTPASASAGHDGTTFLERFATKLEPTCRVILQR